MDVFLIGVIVGMVLGFILSTISIRMTIGSLRKKVNPENEDVDDPANWWKHRRRPYHEEHEDEEED
jgi:hypothetical protein